MNTKGFTLIEVMIVVVILGILAVIITAQFNKPQDKVKTYINNRVDYSEDTLGEKISDIVKTIPIDSISIMSGIQCLGGNKVINIDGKTYWLGNEPDTWGDLKSLPCE